MKYKTIAVHPQVPEEWLQVEVLHASRLLPKLVRPTVVKVAGETSHQGSIWLVTLQHANESTGLYLFLDLWQRLRAEGTVLPFDLYCLIANGYAANATADSTPFSRRFAPYQADFNRCWYERDNDFPTGVPVMQRREIKELTDVILESEPNYILDIHNTTGENQPLGFTVKERAKNALLYSMVDHIIRLEQLPGSLIQRFGPYYAAFGLECGKTDTFGAFQAGRRMLDMFLTLTPTRQTPIHEYGNMRAIKVKDDVEIGLYDPRKGAPADGQRFWIRNDVEGVNQEDLLAFGAIGCFDGKGLPVVVMEGGRDVAADYFTIDGKMVVPQRPGIGQLFSTNLQNVRDSELGYISDRL